ncbi:receptor-transporting protein 4, partial [Mus caroli]|uniref:Receptor-transporting protein 4 n=1 Tax=Mus caroli TaxID=10089 RepID=A0A6P7Q7W8_MUSCR
PVRSVASQGHRGFLSSVYRFQCSRCCRSWTSAQVMILCHMYQDTLKSQGQARMRIFGQKCQKCFGCQFETPKFSTEVIQRILNNLVNYILQRYYGHRKIAMTSNATLGEKVTSDGPHDIRNCEACSLNPHGRCALAHKVKLPRSPSPLPKSSSPSKSCSPPPQTWNTDLGNRCREPPHREIGPPLILFLSIAALALFSLFTR